MSAVALLKPRSFRITKTMACFLHSSMQYHTCWLLCSCREAQNYGLHIVIKTALACLDHGFSFTCLSCSRAIFISFYACHGLSARLVWAITSLACFAIACASAFANMRLEGRCDALALAIGCCILVRRGIIVASFSSLLEVSLDITVDLPVLLILLSGL